jgi:hypothetical protein
VSGSCVHDNEISISVKRLEFLRVARQPSSCLIKKHSMQTHDGVEV